ncbi:YceI family protein [Streptomyces sp. ME03-5709C]|nr:YceI family protein [Streptomyces sp. ME03-5709C]
MTTMPKLSDLTGTYVIDTAHTRIGFVARHTMANKVPGAWESFEGRACLDGDDPSRSTAELTIHAASIQTHNSQRDALLRSRFLDIGNHPTISFTSAEVGQVGETAFKVTGDLGIRGVVRPVDVDFRLTSVENDEWGHLRVRFAGRARINRKDWSVHWAGAAGLVEKTVVLELDVVAIRQP